MRARCGPCGLQSWSYVSVSWNPTTYAGASESAFPPTTASKLRRGQQRPGTHVIHSRAWPVSAVSTLIRGVFGQPPIPSYVLLLTNTTRQRCYSQLPCCYSNWSPAVSCAIYSWAIVLWHYCQRACCTSISRTLKHPARRGATGLLSAAGRPEAADSLDPNVIRLPWRRSPLFSPMSESSPVPFIIVVHCQMSTVDYQSASVGSSVESRTTARLHRPRLLTLRRHGKTGSRWYRHRRSTLACRARTS